MTPIPQRRLLQQGARTVEAPGAACSLHEIVSQSFPELIADSAEADEKCRATHRRDGVTHIQFGRYLLCRTKKRTVEVEYFFHTMDLCVVNPAGDPPGFRVGSMDRRTMTRKKEDKHAEIKTRRGRKKNISQISRKGACRQMLYYCPREAQARC